MAHEVTQPDDRAAGSVGPRSSAPPPQEPRVANRAVDWELAHAQLLRLARRRAGLDLEEGRTLLLAFRTGAHVRLGYGSFAEYVERLLGYAPRLTHEKLRVAEALETLSALPRALGDATLSWSAIRELTRVATPQTETEWLAAARGRTMRDVERLVAGHRPGSLPQDPVEADERRCVLRFEVSATTLATFREAVVQIRREAGEHLDDDATLLQMARQVLGGPRDEGRASYQVAMTLCESCHRAQQHSHGELIDVDAATARMASCDAQEVAAASAPHAAPDGRRASGEAISLEGAERATRDRAPGGAGLEGAPTPRPRRATQDVPPATRRLVLRRDGGRCRVPGCRHTTFVDLHHLLARTDGGTHVADNLIVLCAAHHRAVHLGRLQIQGRASEGLRFLHADGRPYGQPPEGPSDLQAFASPRGEQERLDDSPLSDQEAQHVAAERNVEGSRAATFAQRERTAPDEIKLRAATLRALRRLGFTQRESLAALEHAMTHVGSAATLELLIRAALAVLVGQLPQAS